MQAVTAMLTQIAKYTPFYVLAAGAGGLIGWWAAHRVAERIDNFDPRIKRGKHGW